MQSLDCVCFPPEVDGVVRVAGSHVGNRARALGALCDDSRMLAAGGNVTVDLAMSVDVDVGLVGLRWHQALSEIFVDGSRWSVATAISTSNASWAPPSG